MPSSWDPIDPNKSNLPKLLPSYSPIKNEIHLFILFYAIILIGSILLDAFLIYKIDNIMYGYIGFSLISIGLLQYFEQKHGFMFDKLIEFVIGSKIYSEKIKNRIMLFLLFILLNYIYLGYLIYDNWQYDNIITKLMYMLGISTIASIVSRFLVRNFLINNLYKYGRKK